MTGADTVLALDLPESMEVEELITIGATTILRTQWVMWIPAVPMRVAAVTVGVPDAEVEEVVAEVVVAEEADVAAVETNCARCGIVTVIVTV
jgi:hypothetical protein